MNDENFFGGFRFNPTMNKKHMSTRQDSNGKKRTIIEDLDELKSISIETLASTSTTSTTGGKNMTSTVVGKTMTSTTGGKAVGGKVTGENTMGGRNMGRRITGGEDVRFPLFKKIEEHRYFFRFHLACTILSFIIPGVLTFLNQDTPTFQLINDVCTVPLVLTHALINFISMGNTFNTHTSSTATGKSNKCTTRCDYSPLLYLVWIFYELIKILLVVIQLGVNGLNFQLSNGVLGILTLEGFHFFITEAHTPRKLFETLAKKFHKILWIAATILLTIYFFAIWGVYLFKNITMEAAEDDRFIQGDEFQDVLHSVITLLDFTDWFNSYLVGALVTKNYGALIYFILYLMIVRVVELPILLASVFQLFSGEDLKLKIAAALEERTMNNHTTHSFASSNHSLVRFPV